MKYILCFSFLFLLTFSAALAQEVEVIKYPQLEKLIKEKEKGGKVKVINFWATWCAPCVKELPHFEALQQAHPTSELEVYLISFDDVEKLENRVKPFIKKRNIKSTVKLLDETDYNAFIDKVDPAWSGAIPATLVIAKGKRKFVEGELSEAELDKLIQEFK